MLIVTVDFVVKPGHAEAFRKAVVANALASSSAEPSCRQFDVCAAEDDPRRVFLYEAYDDRSAFDAHLRTDHFKAFDALTSGWIEDKTVRLLDRLHPA
ncbi:MAG: putative quinol monooxygenase [Burkholderiales bacterium]